MDLEGMIPSEISQTWKDKHRVISHIWNLKTSSLKKQRVEWWLLGAGRKRKWGAVFQLGWSFCFTR